MVIEVVGVLARFLQMGSACLLTGIFAFAVFVAPPARRAAGTAERERLEALDRRLLRLAMVAIAVAVGSGLLDLARQALVATDGRHAAAFAAPTIGALLGQTRYGDVWLVRQLLWILLAALLVLREPERTPLDWVALRLAGLVLAGASLAIGAASGHAASAAQWTSLAIAADGLHLVAAGVWAGALIPLLLLLRCAGAGRPDALRASTTAAAVRRFSTLGLLSVIAIVASGVYAIPQQVGSVPALLGTTYGRWLVVKLALLVPLLAIALLNRAYLRPRLEAGAATPPDAGTVIVRLQRSVALEAVLVAAIIGAVAILGLTTPARHDPITWPLPFRLDWDTAVDGRGGWLRVAVGAPLAAGGILVALVLAIARRRSWRLVLAGVAAVAVGLTAALPPLAVDAYPTTYLQPTVPYTATSILRGHALFLARCAGCHGLSGAGAGRADTTATATDLTRGRTADRTVGDLFWWVAHEPREPGAPGAGLSVEQRWDVVNFLRTLSAAEAARGLTATVSSSGTIVAPDVSYTPGVGSERLLREFRGRTVVLLVFFRLPESRERLLQLAKTHFDIRTLGAEILAVPLDQAGTVYQSLGGQSVLFPFAIGGAEEAVGAYRFFGPEPPLPRHMEMLIDYRGYLRARWIPSGVPTAAEGWGARTTLLKELSRLAGEARSAPILGEHIH